MSTKFRAIKRFFKQNASSFSVGGGFSILPIIFSSTVLSLAYAYESEIMSFDWRMWILVYITTCFTMAFAITPTTLIAILSGYFLGWISLIGLVPSYLMAAFICYQLISWVDHGKFSNSIKENKIAMAIVDTVHQSPLKIVIFTKISPILPFALSNMLLAWAKTPIKQFLWGSLVGMLPRSIIAVWAGKTLVDITHISEGDSTQTYQQVVIGLLIILSIVGLTSSFKKNIEKQLHK
ncbi:VTT domain-containing protein [Flammeovirga yaeyamensis]|uniref:TVP38/TMEM64 family membrane protein n=1 Tax=Flammeovirga yaeyamensis TaxID=367791 RepID=A0AAX1N7R0_9BACT|nr:VTT domain-containing protein [Flammeovirga yaeyamensis]MBB3701519.1 putative membrane protein YdjX (TVP38/TMEM64 family) [Flammeovirga yaeyamensis]NMF38667.1 VTT domain-containing protein [Flammeovirga yaeyamensis]QWG01838.1 VTT domain-containing protein [Flammeovirga yaeyamensis]